MTSAHADVSTFTLLSTTLARSVSALGLRSGGEAIDNFMLDFSMQTRDFIALGLVPQFFPSFSPAQVRINAIDFSASHIDATGFPMSETALRRKILSWQYRGGATKLDG